MAEQKFAWNEPVFLRRQSAVNLAFNRRIETDYPFVVHPLTIIHPETGRKSLNFSPNYSLYVIGMSPGESDDLLAEIADHVFQSGRAYFHQWTTNEMVLWDNWRMLHMAAGTPPGENREVHRTTIAGDYRWGRILDPV
jgi:taurine dioxygenase